VTVPTEKPSAYLQRLPIGTRLPLGEVADDDLFPFEGEMTTKPLEAPRLPEPPRRGEPGGDPCGPCQANLNQGVIWEHEHWWVLMDKDPHGLPGIAVLLSKDHHDLEDLPPHLASELGPMIQRVARAVGRIEGVGRVHVNRWGDGGSHFHVWFLARPRGMWQMRGAMLAVWDDLLPRVPAEEWQANRRTVADALAEEGGTSRLA
jgi:diadenosine tetraphosphate (Ap4A) HIT family hydrolase